MFHDRRTRSSHARTWRRAGRGNRPPLTARSLLAIVAGLPAIAVLAIPQVTGTQLAFASRPVVNANRMDGQHDDGKDGAKNNDAAKNGDTVKGSKSNGPQPTEASGDKAKDGTSKDGKPEGNKPQGGKPEGNKPQGGKPEGNQPQGGDKPDAKKDAKAAGKPVACDPNALIVEILQANAAGGGVLDLAEKCTYTLTVVDGGDGLPPILVPLEIRGNHATIIRAANASSFRLLEVGPGGNLTLSDIVLAGGLDATGVGGGALLIQAGGTATVIHSTLRDNRTGGTNGSGGAVRNLGVLRVKDSTLTDNFASGSVAGNGGAISSSGGVLEVINSKVARNFASIGGGGIDSRDTLFNMVDTTVNDNLAPRAGGVGAFGPATITHSEISDNHASAAEGGGLLVGGPGPVTVRDSLIKGNSAFVGGGIANLGPLTLDKVKVTGNSAITTEGGIAAFATLVLRHSEVRGNKATVSIGGIGARPGTTVSLIDTLVTENSAATGPGGVNHSLADAFTLDPTSLIINNGPTNCIGSLGAVTGCFG